MSPAAQNALCIALGILPVTVFLVILVLLDSYKLVRPRTVAWLLAFGCASALLAMVANPRLQSAWGLELRTLVRYAGPFVEEVLKGSAVVYALLRRRIGFLVDAAIWGFTVGAGFAAVENVSYFLVLAKPEVAIWMVRGFGTAVMHGGTTALFAVLSMYLSDRNGKTAPWTLLPGFALAVLIHSAYNHFYLAPGLSALTLLVVLPVLFLAVYQASERSTRDWLGAGFDNDQELLGVIYRGEVSETRIGAYLENLKEHFAPEIVVDMLCLIRLHLELSIKAKGALLLQEAGLEPPADPEVESHFKELRYLEKSVGKTGLVALRPIFHTSSRDLWQFHHLRGRQA